MPSKKRLSEQTKEEVRARADQIRKEAAIEQAKATHDELAIELDVAYDDSALAEATAWNSFTKKELESEWEQLRRIAKVEFPEGRSYFGLSPQNRLVAIAKCLGWTPPKISKASGININTVYSWLNRPDIKVFMDDFDMKQGVKDPDKLVTANAVEGLKVLQSILRDKDNSDATKRLKLQAASIAMDRKWGKANQPVDHNVGNIKDLLEAVKNVEIVELSEEDEKALFSEHEQKRTLN